MGKIFIHGANIQFGTSLTETKIHGRFFISTKWWLISALSLLAHIPLFSQLQQNQRLEIPLNRNENSFEVLPVRNEGVVLYREVNKPSGFQVILIDTLFQQKWTGILPVEAKLQMALTKEINNKSFFLFHRKDFIDIHFYIYEVDLSNGNFKKYEIANFIPFVPTHFEVTNEGALIGGYFVGQIPVILFFDFTSLHSKVLPGLFNEAGELTQIKTNADDSFNVLINSKNNSRQKTLWIKNYDAHGGLIQNATLNPQENSGLLFGRIININNETQIIAGVYGNRNSDYSKGLFLARIDSEKNHELFYYPFADLQNFFKYMKAKREKRVKERIERRRINGRKLRLQYRFLVHEFIPYKDEFILLGEAFYPKYKQMDQTYGYGLVPGFNAVFDGYQYTHAIIIGFDELGKLMWDNSFEINDVRTFTLEQFVKMDVQNDKIALLYLYKDKIRSKIIQNNKVLEGKVYNQLNLDFEETHSPEDVNINRLDYWYHDNFLIYGTQSIPHTRFSRAPRQAFYVNKLRYN